MKFVRCLIRLLYPNRCFLCRRVVQGERALCEGCEGDLPYTEETLCLRCGKRREECVCGDRASALTAAVAPLYYVGAAAAGVRRVKYNGNRTSAALLGEWMADAVSARFAGVAFDGLVYVPMTAKKEAVRGCSSAKLLAQELSRRLALPILESGLRHTGVGGSQTKAGAFAGRTANAKKNFRINKQADHSGRVLLLVDDILTTGATAERCAELLRRKGARQIWLICAATTCAQE